MGPMRIRPKPSFRRPKDPAAPDPVAAPEVSPQEKLVIRTTAYVEALHQAWFAAALEQTKSVFTLASAGVGLALTLMFSTSRDVQTWVPGWLFVAALFFGLCSGLCIAVFKFNVSLVAKLVQEEEPDRENGLVGRMHFACLFCFGVGIAALILSALAFIVSAKPPAT